MNCPYCGHKLNANATKCSVCGSRLRREPVKKGNTPERVNDRKSPQQSAMTSSSGGFNKKYIAVAVIILIVAAAIIVPSLLNNQQSEQLIASEKVESVELDSKYKVEDCKIPFEAPVVTYEDGTTETISDYEVYINDEYCTYEDGYIWIPNNIEDENCYIEIEWEYGDEKLTCEQPIKLSGNLVPDIEDEEMILGNSIGNITYGGRLLAADGYLYYFNDLGLVKYDVDYQEEEILDDTFLYGNDLNAHGDWIYFIDPDSNISRIRNDGTELETILDSEYVSTMVVYGDKIFFSCYDPEDYLMNSAGDIYVINIDGSNFDSFIEGDYEFFGIYDGWLYYADYDCLERTRVDGSETEIVLEEFSTSSNIAMEDGFAYCVIPSNENYDVCMLSKIDLENGEITELIETDSSHSDWPTAVNVKDGIVYYMDINLEWDFAMDFAKIDTDGQNYEPLPDGERITCVYVNEMGAFAEGYTEDGFYQFWQLD